MGKSVANSVLDALLAKVATATIMTACATEPTTRTEAVTTKALADVAPTFAAVADAAGGGREQTTEQKTGVTVDANGTADHVALSDGVELLYVTTCTSQALTAGNTMTFNAWKITIGDPA